MMKRHQATYKLRALFGSQLVQFFTVLAAVFFIASTLSTTKQRWSPEISAGIKEEEKVGSIVAAQEHHHHHHHDKEVDELLDDHEAAAACDVFDGRWVLDEASHPLYSAAGCRYISDDFACHRWGRKDSRYQQWRWQPRDCNLPRFDGKRLMERLRGKRMVFVGDSINRNQFFSMVCLVDSHLPQQPPLQNIKYNGSFLIYTVEEYNSSIEFYWSPFLVESDRDNPEHHRVIESFLIRGGGGLAAIEKHARRWGGADILVFDSYLWWKLLAKSRSTYSSILEEKSGKDSVEGSEIELLQGMRQSLKSWSRWLELNLRPQQHVYYMSQSPTHFWIGEGGGEGGHQSCYNQTEPVMDMEYRDTAGTDEDIAKMVANAVEGLERSRRSSGGGGGANNVVRLLNITRLSEYRKDGHTSVFKKFWSSDNNTTSGAADPDCTHWCLPGVPDVWNELLYSFIIRD